MSVDTNDWPMSDRFAEARRPALHLSFNGTLSDDERRMLQQGYGNRGTNYDVLLRERERTDAIREAVWPAPKSPVQLEAGSGL